MGKIILSVADVTKKCYNSGSVYQVVTKMVSKCAQDMKEKKSPSLGEFFFRVAKLSRKMSRGGGLIKTPPPAFLGLSNIDCFAHFITLLIALLI